MFATAFGDRTAGRRIVLVEPAFARAPAPAASAREPAPAAASAALRVASAAPAGEVLARVAEPIEPADLASADVLLELNAADLPLEQAPLAMLAGVVPIVTPVDGHEELITDSENGLVVGFDDVPGTARALDTLARDRDLLARLRVGAL